MPFGRILYGGLALGSLAMFLFVAGFFCFRLGLALLAGFFYAVAGKFLLLALVGMGLLGLAALAKALYRELRGYFRRDAAEIRCWWALRNQIRDAGLRAGSEARQMRYRIQIERGRLSAANQRKHLRQLRQAIEAELTAAREYVPAATYRSLRKSLRQHYKRADAAAMLALRKQLSCS
ncbi:hypothetical protein NP603_04610 [Methylomonas sp. SURF-1]|uniref:Uncharacterized protein n=1 Tax=Methylomonas aurea TaxID=2952224 RepID=A0ABT1UFA9_9GAMM|nr:hypothetical protein [Methylomonas sp. SURF-1]MCQ8180380.1 hypothetical protein [Methylomonas sp. SURF-1]